MGMVRKLGRRQAADATRDGFTVIELMLVMGVVLLSLLLFSQSIGSAAQLGDVNRETRIALEAANRAVETLRGEDEFGQVFALYNHDQADDPFAGAPGPDFAVEGLEPRAGDTDGFVGEYVFPAFFDGAGLVVSEAVVDEALGMPRDLNADGDTLDQFTNDYVLLPVLVRLSWQGESGPRTLEVLTLISEL